ncbi:MAG: hypothetical protein A2Z62_01500 [Candidatus Terrybacteria bacterium RIFCSPLOWO2_02_42_20]|uniref:Ig-like domain-containing protein n=1 Tax=Candidatus Terrybacteria bacterium RIFCSPLOWO2_02_42_20 TaxID=1802370 RepID=A0A1G2Q1R1_9BACT|nr:MAG: hypothetical protein A2Z62_01500 [Candidatus Terrybacteria bacterium RIFCSPLOWO2_02_42_20]
MKKGFIFFISLLAVSAVFTFSKYGLAQEINDYSSDFTIELVPDNPRPDQAVSAKVISYQFDVDRSEINWILDGKTIAGGQGKKTADFVLPSLGKESILTVNIVTNQGVKTSKTKKFSGSDIDFLWQANTSVPAGYKGKALAGRKTYVKITALPHLYSASGAISRSNLVYDWTFNYKNLPDDSGAGKNTLLIRLNDMGDYVIGVKVSTKDKRTSFQKYLHLSAEAVLPKLVFYADNPLEGPFYGKALGNKITLKTKDINIRAEPYFFNNEDGKTTYRWSMNGKSVKSGKKPNTISLVSEENSGQARINFEMEKEIENNLQSADGGVNIAF